MTTLKLMLKALGYTILIFLEAFIFAWIATGNGDLGDYAFLGGVFLGILAVLTGELKKGEAVLAQQSREKTAVIAPPLTPVLTGNAPGTDHASTTTVVDLNFGKFDLHVAIRTDVVRAGCVPSQYSSAHALTRSLDTRTTERRYSHDHDRTIRAL